ncbi:type VI secretion system Vgr family protein [Rubrivirga sp.]|uniref:type VI secretion system Vgr family protein n=1 Tax=Rubrivirga sp. TaxID=1885344 RepID=UPI003B52E5E2
MAVTVRADTSHLQFAVADLPEDTFQVTRFAGREAVSEPFRFELDLVSDQADVDLAAVLGAQATFTRMRAIGDPVPVHGVVAAIHQAGRSADRFRYRAVLVPRLWRLGLGQQSRVFQDVGLADLARAVLRDAGLAEADVEISLAEPPPQREYVVQYNESDLAFLSRQLEHAGAWYVFRHDEAGRDRLVIADDRGAFAPIAEPAVPYREGAGFGRDDAEAIERLSVREQLGVDAVRVRDYNYRTPETGLEAEAPVGEGGDGVREAYAWGDHHKDPEEGRRLARVRAEEVASRRRVLAGSGDCAGFRAGRTFTLTDHYRADLDGDYLLVEVLHAGAQTGALGASAAVDGFASDGGLLAELGPLVEPDAGGDGAPATTYVNRFTALPAAAPFRPERRTPRPRVGGVMTARVETAGGPYAFLDEDGRYRARMPFDRSAEPEGAATRPIRMAQPYSGPGYGIHFPNHAGTELVFACVDGDPDRPLALGTVPNPSQHSPAVAENRMQNVVRTFAGSELVMDDTQNAAFVRLASPDQNAVLLDDDKNRVLVSTTGKHTVTLDDDNRRLEARSSGGHLVVLDDENRKATLQSTAGHFVSIDDAGQTITVADASGAHTVTIDAGAGTIALDTSGSITMKAGGAVDVQCATFTVAASGSASVDAGGTMDLAAGGALTAKGATVTSQASGSHTTKGASVTSQAAGAQTVKGAMTTVEGSVTTVKGGLVKIN